MSENIAPVGFTDRRFRVCPANILSFIPRQDNIDDIVSFIDVDIDAYRRKLDNCTVRKNLTLPSGLNEQAEQANINFSRVLQNALKEELQIAN